MHAVVARSTFRSQNAQNTPLSDHFWKLRCRKSARRCGAKHISKSKCTKHTSSGPLLAVEMLKKVHAVVALSTFGSQNVKNTRGSNHFLKFRCRKSARRCGAKHIFQVKMLKTPGFRTTFGGSDVRFASLHYITLHYTPLHCTALLYTTLHNTTTTTTQLHYTPLHCTALHYTTVHNTTTTTTQLHSTTLHYTKSHYTTLDYITPHYATFHYTKLHYTTLHYTTLHCIPLHSTTLQ